jgi:ATP-binding cassette subfamily B protein
MEKNSRQGPRKALSIYLAHMRKHWAYTSSIFASAGIGTILVFYVPPLVIAQIIAKASDQNIFTLSNAWYYAVWFGGVWLLGEALWRFTFFLMQKYEVKAFHDFYQLAMQELLKKDLAFFNNRFGGSITKNVVSFGRRFESFFDTITFEIVANIVPAIFALFILSSISPLLSVVLTGMIVLGVSIVRPLIRRRVSMVKDREAKHSMLAGHISDVVSNIMTVKSHGLESREEATHYRHVTSFVDAALKSWHFHNTRIDTIVSPIYVLTNVFGLLIILSIGVDNQTKGNLFLAFSYFANVSRFMWSFNGVYRRLEESITEAGLFAQYLMIPNTVKDRTHSRLKVTSGKIEFNNVTFSHAEDKGAPLFNDLNVVIKSGEKIGLVGHSGAGKTTLVALLERFIDIDGGEILIDGQNIVNVTQSSLHQSISYVAQEPSLFHRTLRENIAYGKSDATDDEIIQASKQANAWEFIETLPNGLDTMVGERGVKLSGGQRQRIAIARAILKDAPILVLDEATSALDSASEKLIQASLDELMKGRTSLVIAHRLSTIAKLDRIIVLEKGQIAEDGTHAELLKMNGIYAKLWSHQSGGFIEE